MLPPLILLAMFAIYGTLHAYAFVKTRAAFSLGAVPAVFLGFFMASMVCAPNLVRVLEVKSHESAAWLASTVGYGWMGILLLFFLLHFPADLLKGIFRYAAPALNRDAPARRRRHRTQFLVILALSLALFFYGSFEAGNVRPQSIILETSRIPAEIGRLRIVHISDVHISLIAQNKRMEKIAALIRQAAPDILVSTGDLVDGQVEDLSKLLEELGKIEPKLGKYAVTGNHEFHSGLRHALDMTERAGFTVLRDEAMNVAGLITIAGIDDPAGKRYGISGEASEMDILSGLGGDAFILLLKHLPVSEKESAGLFDLQLSGHTHDGQIFPFGLMVRLFFPHGAGLHELPKGSHLYVSRGAGTCGPPIRLLCTPEIAVIDLVHET